ncbi:MAG TPA: TetR/AcrR family transcriptional regulator C-terminal domain-containing protein [Gammaproteobacteria bacterium]
MARREPLTRERILEAATSLADAEGIGAVTMRRLAAGLGVEAMSLYHHVPNKDALLDGVVATIIATVQDAVRGSGGDGWQAALRNRCLAARDVMARHPWAPGLIGTRKTIPASVIFYYEEVLGLLIEGGFSYALAHKALHALGSMPLGFVQELFSPAASGGSVDVEAAEAEFEKLAAALPHMMAMAAAEIHANDGDMLGWCDSRKEFEFTLDLLLDGLERRRAALSGPEDS